MKNIELVTFPNPDALARAATDAWLDEIETAAPANRPYCVALSGGRIAQKLFTTTVAQAAARQASFDHVHFFWADERCVPPTDPESNFKLADEWLFTPLNLAAGNIHRLRGEEPPAAAAARAEAELRQVARPGGGQLPALDLIILGMGEDGHVASLFPPALAANAALGGSFMVVVDSPKPPPTRISVTYPAILAARQVWILVSGAGKAAALRAALSITKTTPISYIAAARAVKIFSDINEF